MKGDYWAELYVAFFVLDCPTLCIIYYYLLVSEGYARVYILNHNYWIVPSRVT